MALLPLGIVIIGIVILFLISLILNLVANMVQPGWGVAYVKVLYSKHRKQFYFFINVNNLKAGERSELIFHQKRYMNGS